MFISVHCHKIKLIFICSIYLWSFFFFFKHVQCFQMLWYIIFNNILFSDWVFIWKTNLFLHRNDTRTFYNNVIPFCIMCLIISYIILSGWKQKKKEVDFVFQYVSEVIFMKYFVLTVYNVVFSIIRTYSYKYALSRNKNIKLNYVKILQFLWIYGKQLSVFVKNNCVGK